MALLARHHRRGIAAVLGAALLSVCTYAAGQDTIEDDVKAAFLYNFTKFVDWPGTLPEGPFRLCVIGDPAFSTALDTIIEGESAYGRPLVRAAPQSAAEARDCRILFVGRGDSARGRRLLAAVRDLPVLTVGDDPGFTDSGGVIRFILENRRVRFDINLPACERAGLTISSKLLRLARRVEGG